MIPLSIFLVCLFFQSPSHISLTEGPSLTFPDGPIKSFQLVSSLAGKNQFLAVITNSGTLRLIDGAGKITHTAKGAKDFVASYKGYLFYIGDGLVKLDLANFQTKTFPTTTIESSSLQVLEIASRDVFVRGSKEKVEVLSISQDTTLASFPRSSSVRLTSSTHAGDFLVMHDRETELAAYRLSSPDPVWRLDAGKKDMKILGIAFKSIPNIIFHMKFNPHDRCLYAATMLGDLYKIEVATGHPLLIAKQFAGSSNNAGLLSDLNFLDIDRDGTDELIASSVDENVYCLSTKDFSIKWQFPSGNENQSQLGFLDVTGDGIPDVLTINDYDLTLSVLDGTTGRLLSALSCKEPDSRSQASLLATDFRGSNEVFVQIKPNRIRVFTIR